MTRKNRFPIQVLLAITSGLLLFLASPGLHTRGICAFFGLVPLFLAMRQTQRASHAALLGLIAGLFWYIPLLYWIVIVLGTYGYMPLFLTLSALFLLALYMSIYLSVWGVLCWRWGIADKNLLFFAPTLWVGLDYLRSFLFTGFPWQDLAYSQYQNTWLLQSADLVGHHGISFLLVFCNMLLVRCWFEVSRLSGKAAGSQGRSLRPLLPAVFLILAVIGYNSFRMLEMKEKLATSRHETVTVIQGNIEQGQKWRPESLLSTVKTYTDLTRLAARRKKAALVVWPETAIPFYPVNHPLARNLIFPLLKKYDLSVLTGAPYHYYNPERGKEILYNRALLLDSTGATNQSYDKQHLVPFGEYIPLRAILPAFSPVVQTMMDFSSGQNLSPISCRNIRIGVLICFESIFPDLARRQVKNGAQLLVNMTNDAWFGRSIAPAQHFSMAVLRSVENRRSLARAANTGISGFIDPLGRIIETSAIFESSTLTASLPILNGRTFFVDYGFYFAPGCLLFSLLLLLSRKKARQPYAQNC